MQYGYNVLVQIIKIYGSFIVYAFLAVVGFIILQRQKSKNKDSYLLIPIAWAILMVSLIMVAMYFTNFVFSPLRLLVFIIFLCPPFVGIALGSFVDYPTWPSWSRSARVICVGLIVIVLSIASVLILYPSQYTLSLSIQNTRSEITGMDWFFNNKDVNIVSAGWYYDPSIYSSYLLTSEQRMDRNDLSIYVTETFPYNLGYNKNVELGQSYQKMFIWS